MTSIGDQSPNFHCSKKTIQGIPLPQRLQSIHPENQTAGIELWKEGVSVACNRTDSRVPSCTIHVPKRARSWKLACGEAELCSQRRGKGLHCLSAASLRTAGVGEPRSLPQTTKRGRKNKHTSEPEGPQYGQHGFSYLGHPSFFPFLLKQKGLGYLAETRLFKVKVRPQNILGEQMS